MNEIAYRHRRACLGQTIAPREKLPRDLRINIFIRLAWLLNLYAVRVIDDLQMLTGVRERFEYHAGGQSISVDGCRIVSDFLRTQRLLTDAPYAAALCATGEMSDHENKKYAPWQLLIVCSCLQLHIIGQHDASIQAALREIRLIATDTTHRPLLDLLPAISPETRLSELAEVLQDLRSHDYLGLIARGLGFLHVVIHDASRQARGVVRCRSINYEPAIVETIRLQKMEKTDDSSMEIFMLSSEANGADAQSDESARIRPGITVRVNDRSGPQKSQILSAIQGRRLTEQLASRQQSLPCAFEQATEWDIQHLMQTVLDGVQQHEDAAAMLLIGLVTGQDPALLLKKKQGSDRLLILNDHPCLCLIHQVPAGTQSDGIHKLLGQVKPNLIIPLPAQLKNWIASLPNRDFDPDTIDLREKISSINKQDRTRLSLSRIWRYLEHWSINHGMDRAMIALLRGETHKNRPALAYTQFIRDQVLENYLQYVKHLFQLVHKDPEWPTLKSREHFLGSQLHLPDRVLHNFFKLLAARLPATPDSGNQQQLIEFHNHYVIYVWALMTFSTGHRDVNAPMGKLTDYNAHQRSWWISDKEVRHGLAARTLILPETAARQVELYLQHLQGLSRRTRFLAPDIAERCEQALSGKNNLLFAVRLGLDPMPIPRDLTPSALQDLLGDHMPWARNWARHHLRTELIRSGQHPELVDAWMGHEDLGEEAFGRHSFISMADSRDLASQIESILQHHQIEAKSGWQTH